MNALEFGVAFLLGALFATAVGTMSMKRRGNSRGDGAEESPPERSDLERLGFVKLRAANDASAVRRSKIHHLIRTWVYSDDQSSQGEYRLRPVLPPEDVDLSKGTIFHYR